MKKDVSPFVKNRVWEVDFIRGLAILLVVWDHAMYDFARNFPLWATGGNEFLYTVTRFASDYLNGGLRFLWRPAFLFLFFFTSGLCTALSKNNLFRGLRLWAVACAVSVVTYAVEALSGEYAFALFGVLHCLAVCVLSFCPVYYLVKGLTALVSHVRKRPYDTAMERWVLTALCLILSGVFVTLHFVYNVRLSEMVRYYATVRSDSKIIGLFLVNEKWWTADYFPLLPFIAFFYLGAGLSRVLYEKKRSLFPLLDGYWNKPFCFVGRRSLVVYLGGQILAIVLGCLANLIAFGSLF
ncbi:MAG: DUF1624 domain-containing protein [Clostridia bacterium]|nr:DUF1624 domain-containing protein [Clostridia bacterium]